MQKNRCKKITAGVALIATVFVMLFSIIYITEHIDHDCTGEDCPICAVMVQSQTNLKTIGTVVIACAYVFLFVRIIMDGQIVSYARVFDSPVSQKVRMNN